jgi:DNA-binding PadR family transcriptional regulator
VVQNLERHGFIEATGTTRQGRRPERTVYGITAAGREELRDRVRENDPGAVRQHRTGVVALNRSADTAPARWQRKDSCATAAGPVLKMPDRQKSV